MVLDGQWVVLTHGTDVRFPNGLWGPLAYQSPWAACHFAETTRAAP